MRAKFNAAPIQTQKLANNVTMFSGPGGVVILNGPDGKFVVDTFVAPAWPKLKKALDGIDNAPVKYAIDTHWHFDHADNNAPFHAAGGPVLAHENTKKRVSEPHDQPVLYRAADGTLGDLHFDPSPAEALKQLTFPPVMSCTPTAKPSRSNILLPRIRIRTSTFIFKRPT
jgi:cyclase